MATITLKQLNDICAKHNIPEDAKVYSDSGWECCETPIGGIFYSSIDNALVLTQLDQDEYVVDKADWHDITVGQTLKKLD